MLELESWVSSKLQFAAAADIFPDLTGSPLQPLLFNVLLSNLLASVYQAFAQLPKMALGYVALPRHCAKSANKYITVALHPLSL